MYTYFVTVQAPTFPMYQNRHGINVVAIIIHVYNVHVQFVSWISKHLDQN